jgi:hypothetical protein
MTQSTPDPGTTSDPAAAAEPSPPRQSFEQRMESFGQDMGAAGERFGRQAEAFGKQLAKDPAISRAADTAARAWGLIILAIGLWFLADVTLGYDMPSIPWGDIWPVGLIVIGLLVVARGMTRRSA